MCECLDNCGVSGAGGKAGRGRTRSRFLGCGRGVLGAKVGACRGSVVGVRMVLHGGRLLGDWEVVGAWGLVGVVGVGIGAEETLLYVVEVR